MIQTKAIYADRYDELEKALNKEISNLDVVDIKFQATQWGEYDARYFALILHNTEKSK